MRRMIVAGVTASFAICVAACGSDDAEPRFADPTETTSTASTGPSPDAESPMTATEAVQTWLAGYNDLLAGGEGDAISAVTADGCSTCTQYLQPLREAYAKGGFVRSDGWKLANEAPLTAVREGRETAVYTAIRETAGRSKSTSEEPVHDFSEQRFILRFVAKKSDGTWKISEMTRLS